jgi:hypothetical protein
VIGFFSAVGFSTVVFSAVVATVAMVEFSVLSSNSQLRGSMVSTEN